MDPARHRLEVPAAVVVGVVGAVAALGVDRAVEVPFDISAANARSLLTASFGALVTAGAFAFWMLPVAAQLAASSVPPPAVAKHLHDRFQRHVIAATLGALAYLAVVVLGQPSGDGAEAPTVATAAGALLGVAAIGMLLVAIQHAVRSTRPSALLSEAAEQVMRQIGGREAPPTPTDPAPDGRWEDLGDGLAVTAPATGWLHAIDGDALLRALPERSTAVLDLDVGSFAVRGWTRVATVHAARGDGPEAVEAVVRHLRIGGDRPVGQDLVGSITAFVDIAVHASPSGSGAPSIVYESLRYLGAILHELASHGGGAVRRRSVGGRQLVWTPAPHAPALAAMAVERIRQETAWHPTMALELVRVLVDARRHAAAAGRDDLAAVLDEQADLVVRQCRQADNLPADVDRVAAARDALVEDPEGRSISR